MAKIVSHQIGSAEVHILTDGDAIFPAEYFPGTDPSQIDAILAAQGGLELATNLNATLIREEGRTILIDGGARDLFGPSFGFVPEALSALGVTLDQIDTLVATHLHADHIAGFLTAEGEPVFPKAQLVLPEAEQTFWSDDSHFSGRFAAAKDFALLAQSLLRAYAGRLEAVVPGAEIAPGLSMLDLPGHTPGHMGWRLERDGASLIHVGDIVHVPALQLAEPDIAITFDIDPDTARATRKRLLEELVSEGTLFTGGHFLHPALSRMERDGARFVVVPGIS